MRALHFGQCEPGHMIDSPRGIRQMQTFRKLPMKLPNTNESTAKTKNISISPTSKTIFFYQQPGKRHSAQNRKYFTNWFSR